MLEPYVQDIQNYEMPVQDNADDVLKQSSLVSEFRLHPNDLCSLSYLKPSFNIYGSTCVMVNRLTGGLQPLNETA